MIEAKELRIGNYLYAKESIDDCVEVVEMGVGFYISEDEGGSLFYPKRTEPIPLTEEWLLKFGFEKVDHIHYNRWEDRDGFEVEIQGDKVAYCIWGGEDAPATTHFVGHCKYVHEFQNMYYVLEHKELTIN